MEAFGTRNEHCKNPWKEVKTFMRELKGIDISEWNGGLNYTELAKNIDFAILREGCRTRKDYLFDTHINGCRAARIPIRGVYHFIYAVNNNQAKIEAESCIKNVQAAGLPKSTWIWADLEYDTITKAKAQGVVLGPAEVRLFTETFCKTIKDAGYPVGIYTNLDYWVRMYGDDILSRYPVWYAQYSSKKAKDCLIWQCGSRVLPGSNGQALDYDIWYEQEDVVAEPVAYELNKSTEELAKEVIAGKWGSGEARKVALGARYDEVQKKVNEMLAPVTVPTQPPNIEQLAVDVIAGKYGTGDYRKKALGENYDAVQKRVNELLKAKTEVVAPALSDRRLAYVRQMQAWVGRNEADGSFRSIIDTYNKGLAKTVKTWGTRNVRMEYSWPWCACTVSAAAIACGLDDVVPIEISCPYMIEIAKKFGIWVEQDSYRPNPGDIIMYDWQDTGYGDNTGVADHVGVVESVEGNRFVVIEGNRNDSVSRRTMDINGLYIRGFIVPNF